jgi:hypothetical protein
MQKEHTLLQGVRESGVCDCEAQEMGSAREQTGQRRPQTEEQTSVLLFVLAVLTVTSAKRDEEQEWKLYCSSWTHAKTLSHLPFLAFFGYCPFPISCSYRA